jgi:hypothetical protein
MKKINQLFLNRSLLQFVFLAASIAALQAQDQSPIKPISLEPAPEPSRNRISVGYQMGFNLNARFKNIGAFTSPNNPGPATNGVDHFYDDGFNRVDATGNNHGVDADGDHNQTTWFWGYQDSSQHVDNTIQMHTSSSRGATSRDNNEDPQPGFNITYSRELYRDEGWRFGVDTAFGYTDLNIKDSHPHTAMVTRLTDTYAIPQLDGGYFVPDPPYSGDSTNAGRIISDTPSRSITSNPDQSITGTREFGADLFGFKLGPYVEIPVNKTVSVSFNGGLAMVYAYSSFRYNEFVQRAGSDVVTNLRGQGNKDGLLFGAYIGGNVAVALNPQWSAIAGAQWQNVGTYTHVAHKTGEKAVLDLSQTIFLTVGLGYSF